MPRKPRIEYAGAVYHVMCRGDRQEAVFRDDRDCVVFLETLGEACERCGWRIHAYVLMGNHYHLLLETPADLAILKSLNCTVAQGYYYSRPLPADAFLDWMRQFPVPVAE